MVEKFTMELRGQREWAWLLALYLFLGSLGGCLFLFYWLFELPSVYALVAIALVLLGAVTLLFKLGSPQRAWRACFRPGTSWISRGVLFVCFFVLFGTLAIAPASWLPWSAAGTGGARWAGSPPCSRWRRRSIRAWWSPTHARFRSGPRPSCPCSSSPTRR